MRVLVCGGRHYANAARVNETLAALAPSEIIEGGATGADSLARLWAKANGVPVRTFPADWAIYGSAAGPIRNAQMLAGGKPDKVVAFPGARGTWDMISRARRAGVEVVEVVE